MQAIQFNPAIHPSFKQQFDKLTEAYIKNKVEPMSACACFVGNLLNGDRFWPSARMTSTYELGAGCKVEIDERYASRVEEVLNKECGSLYTLAEIYELEQLFMSLLYINRHKGTCEEVLFEAFAATLDLLKQIHLSKGETIDEVPAFTKRQLATV